MSTRGGLQVEYAVSSRASCKQCGGSIAQDSVRVGKETKSEHHDGWDMSWYHLKCCNKVGGPTFTKSSELKHWERLRWDDQIKVKQMAKEPIDNSPAEAARKKHIDTLWKMKDQLTDNLNNKQIKALMEANTEEMPEKIQQPTVNHVVADGMLWGRIGPCPTCKSCKLFFDGTDYKCKGWVSGFTRCDFKGTAGVTRTKWVIPPALQKIGFLKTWKYPADHATAAFGSAGSGGGDSSVKSEPKVEDTTPEDDVPVGKELYPSLLLIQQFVI